MPAFSSMGGGLHLRALTEGQKPETSLGHWPQEQEITGQGGGLEEMLD